MDLRLKRRLVGGAVLILLAVIFLPMLFEDALRERSPFDVPVPEPPAPGELPAVSVVSPRPQVPLPSAWAVQVGSFSQVDNARKLEVKLRDAGFAAFVEAVANPGGTLYRVRVGPLLDKSEAAALADRIKEKTGMEGLVVPHPR